MNDSARWSGRTSWTQNDLSGHENTWESINNRVIFRDGCNLVENKLAFDAARLHNNAAKANMNLRVLQSITARLPVAN